MPEAEQAADQAAQQEQDEAAQEASAESTSENQQDDEDEGDLSPEALQKEIAKWKKLSRQNEAAAKRNAEAAKSWAEHQDSLKTEQQKTQEQLEQLQADRDAAKREAAVYRAISKHGLSAEDLELLEGVPADQLEDRAERLAARLKASRTPSPKAGIGRETPPGAGQSGDWLRNALRAQNT